MTTYFKNIIENWKKKKLKKGKELKNIELEYHLRLIISYNSNGNSKILKIY